MLISSSSSSCHSFCGFFSLSRSLRSVLFFLYQRYYDSNYHPSFFLSLLVVVFFSLSLSKTFAHSITIYTHRSIVWCVVRWNSSSFNSVNKQTKDTSREITQSTYTNLNLQGRRSYFFCHSVPPIT